MLPVLRLALEQPPGLTPPPAAQMSMATPALQLAPVSPLALTPPFLSQFRTPAATWMPMALPALQQQQQLLPPPLALTVSPACTAVQQVLLLQLPTSPIILQSRALSKTETLSLRATTTVTGRLRARGTREAGAAAVLSLASSHTINSDQHSRLPDPDPAPCHRPHLRVPCRAHPGTAVCV